MARDNDDEKLKQPLFLDSSKNLQGFNLDSKDFGMNLQRFNPDSKDFGMNLERFILDFKDFSLNLQRFLSDFENYNNNLESTLNKLIICYHSGALPLSSQGKTKETKV